MNYGIKISQQDVDLMTNIKNEPRTTSLQNNAHILLSLAVPYLNGAYEQVKRYEIAASQLTPQNAADAVSVCLHEISSLFEDVCTVSKYVSELCGYKNEKHQLWLDARNHIRHDVRENFDTTSKDDAKRREKRLARLGISDKLQSSIGFDKNRISIGTTIITMDEVKAYLSWASRIITGIIEKAEAEGKIRHS